MKLAEVVAKFLESQGIRHVFGVSGGACLHLIHGIADATKIKFIPTTHECNAGFAADAYARLTGLGCALATSGPGATNLITAIATAYYDSVPVLFITGNVATHRFAPPGVRQYGFQETPIVEMVKPVTKYARTVMRPEEIRLVLEMVVQEAKTGRPGPVLVDIPDDLQRVDVDVEKLQGWSFPSPPKPQIDIDPVERLLRESKRPIFIWGAGMRGAAGEARRVAENLQIPVACTWGAIDLLNHAHPLMAGGFGTHGTRAANLAVQNADLIISLGCRLDTKATGQIEHFARSAKIVMVDLDQAEIEKLDRLGLAFDVPICADVGDVLDAMAKQLWGQRHTNEAWPSLIRNWRKRYDRPEVIWSGINPYQFVRELGKEIQEDSIICSDTGFALGWMMQGYPFKGERFLHAFNMTPMGWGLAGAIGAAFASGRPITLISGDGSLMMSLAELATVARWDLPIRIILLNNQGHGMCRQTQRQWLGGTYPGTSIEGGLGFPDFSAVSKAFGVEIEEIPIHPDAQLVPQAKYGQPLEDADPQLPWEELTDQMIIPPLERA